ncbi:hypothetical protein CRUP_029143 [Coryphaenoides rupestris]|nr:hypothetical protein CRUP_029143 [Coryphaenoides rupestris]
MAAHRIKATTNNSISLPRCKSEGTLIDLSDGVSEASLTNVKVPSPSALRLNATTSFSTAREVVAIKDYCPSNFTTLKFSKGERLYVLDTSGGEWWYAHNNTELGYIPAAYVEPINDRDSSFSDSGMIDTIADCNEEAAKEMDLLGEWEGVLLKQAIFQNSFFGSLKAPAPEQFQSREDFRAAWLNHRKLARSCHDLDSLGQSPGWGQTQPVETNIALLRMDCQGLVARLVMDFVLLTTAVEVAGRWRELADRLAKVSRQQMDAYEAPHRAKNGVVDSEGFL